MSNFVYRLHKIIGVARIKHQGAIHSSIYPLGWEDNNYHFQPFSKKELKSIFKPNGTVFGSKIPDYLLNVLSKFSITECEFYDDPKKDLFCREKDVRIEKYVDPIVNTTMQGLTEAIKQGIFNCYYKVSDKIYYITEGDSKKGIAKYWTIEEDLFETNRNICMSDDDVFLIRDSIDYPFNYSDISTKEEIINFTINLINTFDIDPQNIRTISDEIIQEISLPLEVLKFRLDEFNALLPSIILTHKSIIDLASNPILSDVLQKSIKEYEDEYIKTYEDHNRELIKKLEQAKEQKLKDINDACEEEHKMALSQLMAINEEIDKAQVRLNEVCEKIQIKENEANSFEQRFAAIEEHKGRLIEDFSMIKDVICRQTQTLEKPLISNIERVTCDGESILNFEDFCSHIFTHLLNNKFSQDSAVEISKDISRLFVAKNSIGTNLSVILIPNLKIFKSLLNAIGRYRLCSMGVAPDWKSYDNLYYNALCNMIKSANNNPNEIHILLLQNMNLSYIPSYMQPINDILIGISNKLPGDHDIVGIPSNFWIFGTRTELNEEAIPISRSNIEEYGCLENKEYTYSDDNITETPKCKFISMEFVNIERNEERRYKSFPDSYIE